MPLMQSASGVPVIPINSTPVNATLAYTSAMSSGTPTSTMSSAISLPTAYAGMTAAPSYEPQFPVIEPQALGLIILAFIATVLDIPVLFWHLRSKNTAASSLVVWVMVYNVFNFINPIIWPNDHWSDQWKGYGLCDVEVKLQVGSFVGLTGSLVAIMRDLCHVMNTKRITLVPSQRRRTVNRIVTGTLCFGFPILILALHYIVQSSRYYLFTLSGCAIPIDNSWLAVVLIEMWPSILATAAASFAGMSCFRRIFTSPSHSLTPSAHSSSLLPYAPLPLRVWPPTRHLQYNEIALPPPLHPLHNAHPRLPATTDLHVHPQSRVRRNWLPLVMDASGRLGLHPNHAYLRSRFLG